jgi:hypothetical protein
MSVRVAGFVNCSLTSRSLISMVEEVGPVRVPIMGEWVWPGVEEGKM